MNVYTPANSVKHIANAQILKKLTEICRDFGYKLPTICTPYELMGE